MKIERRIENNGKPATIRCSVVDLETYQKNRVEE